ncbi:MAG: peptidase S15 [Acidiferrobacteraceae bacterium]|nr:peptidase S15 [Acidiferrobacteraceae bacterium]
MWIEWDVSVTMDDGLVLKADIFRPPKEGQYPVILTYGPYAKGLPFQTGYPSCWQKMEKEHPDVTRGSTNKYQNWEVVDPEKWVPYDYICIRVDSRGCGRSPGYLQHFSPREIQDFYDCIEWAGTEAWSNGKVGLSGVSYYAMAQYPVASRQPPHLAAMISWEGSADWYRDATHHGGILSTFWANWYDMQVKTIQHGWGERGGVNPNTGELISGPVTMAEDDLQRNRTDFGSEIINHPLIDYYYKERTPDWSRVEVPMLTAANWGGQGLHLRGNTEAYVRAASKDKWLEIHGIEHWTEFYTDYGVELQRRFLDYYLKGKNNGWDKQPSVQLQIRTLDGFIERHENEWPIERTNWTRMYLDTNNKLLIDQPSTEGQISYSTNGDGVSFFSDAMANDTEITGPSSMKLFVSSETIDADIFVVLRVFSPDDTREVVFQGAIDPHTPIGQGWLRASHRKLDPTLSEEYRPYHSHDEKQPLVPGEIYELDIEIWPTSVVVPQGYQLAVTIRGCDYEYPGDTGGAKLSNFKNELKGCGPFLHDDPRDRPPAIFGTNVTIYSGASSPSSVLIPIIPKI